MRSHEYEKQRAQEIAQSALDAGYRPFIAEKGNYGFYTDADGTRVVSFQVNGYFEESVSGNYVTNEPQKTGTGWRIADSVNTQELDDYFNMNAPRWAVGDAKWRHATLTDELNRYQSSSRFKEIT